MTALLNAVRRTIDHIGERLDASQEPENVFVIILAACKENASSDYDRYKSKLMIEHLESKFSWQFIYVGAN